MFYLWYTENVPGDFFFLFPVQKWYIKYEKELDVFL